MIVWPHWRMCSNPKTGLEVDLQALENEEILKRILETPNLFERMKVHFWNVRGINCLSFPCNFPLVIILHISYCVGGNLGSEGSDRVYYGRLGNKFMVSC